MGQYMPVLNKDGSLHRGCRVYKIILQEAGIDYNTLTERESHDLYKYWNGRDPDTDMIRNPRLASALRMAHAAKHIGSLDAGHANCLLYLAGLKNEKKEGRGRQGNSSGSGSGSGSIRCASDAAASTPRLSPPPRLRQSERQREDYDTRDYSSDDTRDYERQEYERQREEYERQEYERRREDFQRRCQEEEYERQREDFELRCQEEEYERRCQEEEDYERYWRQEKEYERQRQEEEDYERRRQEEEYERQRQEEEDEQRYCGTVVRIKKKHADGTPFAFVQPGDMFLHASDMRPGEMWVDEGDQIKYSIGYFNGRQKCVDVVIL